MSSAIAVARSSGWEVVHRVEGREGPSHCTYEDDDPVVIDIAVARGTLFTRRAWLSGTTGFIPTLPMP